MPRAILGKKIGMTQLFAEDGTRIGVTVIECPPNHVLQIKTADGRDGYQAVQVGIDEMKDKVSTKPEIGHAKKAGCKACRFVKELDLDDVSGLEVGGTITIDSFEGLEKVIVTGTSKGKGTAGVMKKYHFGGYRATHGVKCHHRKPGSIGMNTHPARVLKGKRMAGHMGSVTVTQKGMKVAKLIPEKNLILIKGSVPGANGCFVCVREDVGYVAPKAAKK